MTNLYKIPEIKWQIKEEFVAHAHTVTHEYHIIPFDEGDFVVLYWNKSNQKACNIDTAPRFKTLAEAKEWVENTHYPTALKKTEFEPVSEPVSDILDWFKLAKPNPIDKDKFVQIGVHYEEFAEMLVAVIGEEHLLTKQVNKVANHYKTLYDTHKIVAELSLKGVDKTELLDSLCDQIVTALGVGYMFGFDMQSALKEVIRSNWSKFENGKPIFDENGKIAKPASYSKPNLEPFLGVSHE